MAPGIGLGARRTTEAFVSSIVSGFLPRILHIIYKSEEEESKEDEREGEETVAAMAAVRVEKSLNSERLSRGVLAQGPNFFS